MVIGSIVAFFKAVGATAVFGTTVGAIISTTITIATVYTGVKAYKQAKDLANSLQSQGSEILANKTSAGGKIPVVYGSRRVGAQIVFMDTAENESKDLFVIYALSVGEVEFIDGRSIELDGNPLNDNKRFKDGGYIGSDKITSGQIFSLNTADQTAAINTVTAGTFGTNPALSYRYTFNLHHGATTQAADPMFLASLASSKWTSAHKLNGIAYIAAHYHYDQGGMWTGVPQLTVSVQGKKVFDPRDSNQTFGTISTYKWSNNPALCFLDYITNNEYGKGLTSSQINMSTFTSAANLADTNVASPDFSGGAVSMAWQGVGSLSFITTTDFTNWSKFKVGQRMELKDDSGNVIVDNRIITDMRTVNIYDGTPLYTIDFEGEFPLNQIYDVDGDIPNAIATSRRFQCNGVIDSNKKVMENAQDLLANMRGIFTYIDGKYELRIEDTGSSTFSITEDHIIGDGGLSVNYGSKDQKANKVIVEFFNGQKKFEQDTAIVLLDASPNYFSNDGDEILELKVEFPFVSDPYVAYNMGHAILVRSRNQTQVSFLGTPEMYKLNVGDIVDLTYTALGFSSKVFIVESLILQSDGLLQVNLIEYVNFYTWEVPSAETVAPVVDLPTAYAIKSPANLAFTDTNSSATGRPFIAWTQPTDYPDDQYKVNVVDSSGNQVLNKIVAVNNVDLTFLPVASNYVATVSALNALGVESPTTSLTFSVANPPTKTADVQDSAITTVKIADANITTAKIGNAQVDTLQIAGQAVTVPVYVTGGSSSRNTFSSSYSTIISATIPRKGLTTLITFTGQFDSITSGSGVYLVRILRGTTDFSNQEWHIGIPLNLRKSDTIVLQDTDTGTGDTTYNVQVKNQSLDVGYYQLFMSVEQFQR